MEVSEHFYPLIEFSHRYLQQDREEERGVGCNLLNMLPKIKLDRERQQDGPEPLDGGAWPDFFRILGLRVSAFSEIEIE